MDMDAECIMRSEEVGWAMACGAGADGDEGETAVAA